GSRRAARSRDCPDRATTAETTCPRDSRAAPTAVPTRPAEIRPTDRRAGGVPVTPGSDIMKCSSDRSVPGPLAWWVPDISELRVVLAEPAGSDQWRISHRPGGVSPRRDGDGGRPRSHCYPGAP